MHTARQCTGSTSACNIKTYKTSRSWLFKEWIKPFQWISSAYINCPPPIYPVHLAFQHSTKFKLNKETELFIAFDTNLANKCNIRQLCECLFSIEHVIHNLWKLKETAAKRRFDLAIGSTRYVSWTVKVSPLSQLHRNRTGQSECEEGKWVHQIYCEESKRKKPPQGRLSNEWPSRNCVSKDTNFCRASAEWCQQP